MVLRMNPIVPNSFWNRTQQEQDIIRAEIEGYGSTPEKLRDDLNERLRYNISYFLRLQKRLEYRGEPKVKRRGLIQV